MTGQVDHDDAGDNSPGEGGEMRGWEADCSNKAGKHCRDGEPLQSHAGVREGTSGHRYGATVYVTKCQAT